MYAKYLANSAFVLDHPVYSNLDYGSGLVSAWRFEGNANDSFGTNNGTVTGATLVSNGIVGSCYSFDGSGDEINASFIPLPSAYTVSYWVKYNTTNFQYHLWNGNNSGTNANTSFMFSTQSSNLLLFRGGNGSTYFTLWGSNVAPNIWYHIVGVNTGSSCYLYINGVASSPVAAVTPLYNSGTEFTIGADGSGSYDFNGLIDEVSVWNRALTQSEITDIYNSGTPKVYPYSGTYGYNLDGNYKGSTIPTLYQTNCEAIYRFEGNANDEFNRYNGTVTGATLVSSGIVGSCYSFDGSGDEINCPFISVPNFYTVSYWVKYSGTGTQVHLWDGAASGANANQAFLFFTTGGNLTFRYGNGTTYGSRALACSPDVWHHVVGVNNGSTCTLYMDGVAGVPNAGAYPIYNSGVEFTMGSDGGGAYDFNGLIDEVTIWSRALSSSEVSSLYNSGVPNYYNPTPSTTLIQTIIL